MSPTSARSAPTWRSSPPTCTPCGSRNACCALNETTHRQSPAARHGLRWAACVLISTPANSTPSGELVDGFEREFQELVELDPRQLRPRATGLETTGVLKPEVARDLGVVGIAGPRLRLRPRSCAAISRTTSTTRCNSPCPSSPKATCSAAWQVRREELFQSFGIIRQVMEKLPAGPIAADVGRLPPDRVALGYVEGWRGEIFHWIHTAPRQPAGALQSQRPVAAKLAGLDRGHSGQHHSGFPRREQELQPVLFRHRPLIMFDILRQSLKHGRRHHALPGRAAGRSPPAPAAAPRLIGPTGRTPGPPPPSAPPAPSPARTPAARARGAARPGQMRLLRPLRRRRTRPSA